MACLPSISLACSCVPGPDFKEQYENYTEVFLGAVTDVLPIKSSTEVSNAGYRVMVRVIEVYKGDPPALVAGHTYQEPSSSYTSSCGPAYTIGNFYIVFRRLENTVHPSVDPKAPPEVKTRYSRPGFGDCSHTVWGVDDEILEYVRSRKNQNDA